MQICLNNIRVNRVQQHINRKQHRDEDGLSRDAGFFNMCNLINMTHHIKRLRNKTYTIIIIEEENIFSFYLNFRNCLERTLIDENSCLEDPRN